MERIYFLQSIAATRAKLTGGRVPERILLGQLSEGFRRMDWSSLRAALRQVASRIDSFLAQPGPHEQLQTRVKLSTSVDKTVHSW